MASNQNNSFQRFSEQQQSVERSQGDGMSKDRPSNSVMSSPTSKLSLDDLKNMFKSAIDAEVVEMIWQDSNENGDVALTYLTEISPRPIPIAAAVKTNTSWSNVLGADTSKQPFTENQGVKPKSSIKEKHWAVDQIKRRINTQEKIVIIMRGVPGSGKSYLAQQLRGNGVVLSTDDYFTNIQGQYNFDRNQLPLAHDWNQNRADKEMKSGTNPVVVDNTNLEAWEMQPYVTMALKNKYSIELIEPDTPWREDVRILSQKNTHRVPREKIRDMLEKQRVVIDIGKVIESCRRKMNHNFEGTTLEFTGIADVRHLNTNSNHNLISQNSPSSSASTNKSIPDIQPSVSPPALLPSTIDTKFEAKSIINPQPDVLVSHDAAAMMPLNSTEVATQTSLSEPSLRELTAHSRSIQTSHFVPDSFGTKPYCSKFSVDKGCLTDDFVDELPTATGEAIAILKSYFPTKEKADLADILKQCNGDLTWAVNLLLDSGYEFPNEVSDDMQLEDEDTEQVEEKLNTSSTEYIPLQHLPEQTKDDEANSVTSSEVSQQSNASASSEETEALRKHIEECFTLTDTISEQTRRICGKDYNQFRASQLQKSRVGQNQISEGAVCNSPVMPFDNQIKIEPCNFSLAGFPSLEKGSMKGTNNHNHKENGIDPTVLQDILYETNENSTLGFDLLQPVVSHTSSFAEEDAKVGGGATISMTLDPSFVQQLVNLFGAPDLRANRPNSSINQPTSVKFDIPWSLAEQIYMLWCSSLISRDEEQATVEGESRELQNIMDFELAMQIVQDERNAERKELRESLSTKLSFKMLQENYPFVDPLALDALFEANNYNYSHTVTALNASLGTKPQPPKNQVIASNPPPNKEESPAITPKREPKSESRDLRTEAFMYNRLRQQYSTQAQEYHQRGMSAAAMYYSSESRRYAELYKICNQQAALQIVEEKNAHQDERTIDLHELHVTEALTCLQSFIVENVREGKTVIQVITGRGNNSQNGRPRIKPAVITFLKQQKYGFEELNPGMLRVFLSRTMTRRVPS